MTWNPYIEVTGGNGGASGSSKFLGDVSPSAKYLIWTNSKRVYSHKGATHWKNDIPIGSGRNVLNVTDKTGIGADVNSKDGYFKVELTGKADTVYKYVFDSDAGCPVREQANTAAGR